MSVSEHIQLDYEGLRWDGTLESAEAICEAIEWVLPRYIIGRSYGTRFGSERRLTIVQGLGSSLPSHRLNIGDLLACRRDERGDLHPERVVPAPAEETPQ